MENKESTFDILNKIDVSRYVEKKNGLSYLSWSFAWLSVKKLFPNTSYKVYENDLGLNYHHDGKTAWVKVGVAINNEECIEYLPIMDFKNKSIPLSALTSMDANKAIQRALTKAIARHGLGLYIYAGEDLPESVKEEKQKPCNDVQVEMINGLILKKGVDMDKFLKAYQILDVSELNFENAGKAIMQLQKKEDI